MANLTQLRMLENLNGVLLVDKPEGIAFSMVVKTIKRKFNLVKVGHGGSLDTMASGLMVILINEANKFVDRVMGADRVYSGVMKFGETTDTGDKYGRPLQLPEHPISESEVKGDLFQTEPRFCAIRKANVVDYEIVDTGEHLPTFSHVYRFELQKRDESTNAAAFSLFGSKGIIVRALAQDLGATLLSLRREKVGNFEVAKACPFAKLLETEICDFGELVLPLSSILI